MIYCNLKGGLGNMLFQIAATKSVSIDIGVDCCFPNLIDNLNYLNADNLYNPKLNHSLEYLKIFQKLNVSDPINIIDSLTYPFEFIPHQYIPLGNFFISGFFQSEKYFVHNRQEIIDFIKMPESIGNVITSKYSSVLAQKTTSIHVRRGDYVIHPNHHPTQSLDYYLSAIELVKDKTDIFVVFSDDIQWCKNNFKDLNAIYIENEKDYIELYLMSFCNNNIIANSSFSWWGAWLNENKNKIVIGPKLWFGSSITHKTDDIIPETWIKL